MTCAHYRLLPLASHDFLFYMLVCYTFYQHSMAIKCCWWPNILIITLADVSAISVRSSTLVVSWWLWSGNRTFLDVDSMVVSWWKVALLCYGRLRTFGSDALLFPKIPSIFPAITHFASCTLLRSKFYVLISYFIQSKYRIFSDNGPSGDCEISNRSANVLLLRPLQSLQAR